MKQLLLIIVFLISGICYANDSIIQPEIVTISNARAKKLVKAHEMKIDTMDEMSLKIKVVEQDSAIKASKDTIAAKEKAIESLQSSSGEHLWGGQEPIFYFWWEFWTLVGIFLFWGYLYIKNGVKDTSTPKSFSFSYWLQNNKKRMIIALWTLLAIFVIGRFFNELFGIIPSDWWALVIGVTFQTTIEYVFKKIESSSPIKSQPAPTNQ